MIFLYPIGIPCLLFLLLFRARKRLRDPGNLIAYGFLYEAYSDKQWYFEMIDMLNKFFLTSIIPFIPTNGQMPVGMTWITLYIFILLFAKPYVRRMDDHLHLLANIHLLLIMLMAQTLSAVSFVPGSATDVAASAVLLAVLGFLWLFMLYNGWVFVRKFLRNRQRIKAKAEEEHFEMNDLYKDDLARNPAYVPKETNDAETPRGSKAEKIMMNDANYHADPENISFSVFGT